MAMAVGAVITLIGAAVVLRFMPSHDLAPDAGDAQPEPQMSEPSQMIEGLSGDGQPSVVPIPVDK